MEQSPPSPNQGRHNIVVEISILFGVVLVLPVIAGSFIAAYSAAEPSFFIFLLFFLTFLFGMILTMGLVVVRSLGRLISGLFSRKKSMFTTAEEEKEMARSFRWTFVVVGFILFGLGGFFFRDGAPSTGDPTHYIFIGSGIAYGALLAWLVKKGYIDPREWEF